MKLMQHYLADESKKMVFIRIKLIHCWFNHENFKKEAIRLTNSNVYVIDRIL